MTLHPLSSYPRDLLIDTLRILKDYKNSVRQVWGRARMIDRKVAHTDVLTVEYAPGMEQSILENYATQSVALYFPDHSYNPSSTIFRANDSLISGIRIFLADDMVDVSFQKFSQSLHS